MFCMHFILTFFSLFLRFQMTSDLEKVPNYYLKIMILNPISSWILIQNRDLLNLCKYNKKQNKYVLYHLGAHLVVDHSVYLVQSR